MVLGNWLEEKLDLKGLRAQRAALEAELEPRRQELLREVRAEFRNHNAKEIRRQARNRNHSRMRRAAIKELLRERLREEVR